MNGYWLTFEKGGRGQGYCQGEDIDRAKARAEKLTGEKVIGALFLPYPATPIIWQETHEHGPTPAFCYAPEDCAGRTSCPKRPSCVE